MECPTCLGYELVETMTEQGPLVDVCHGCDGIWLDRGEIFEFSDDRERLQRALDEADYSGEPKERACPRCQVRMTGITFLTDDLWLDYCPECGGLWFDAGELERAVEADPASFGLQIDDSASLEVDWEAVDATPRRPTDASGSAGGARAGDPVADGGDLAVDPRHTPRRSRKARPSSAVNDAIDVTRSAGARGSLPNLALRSLGVLVVLYGVLGAFLVALADTGRISPTVALMIGGGVALLQFAISPLVMDVSLDWVYSMHWATNRQLPEHLDDFIGRVCGQEEMPYPDIGIIHDGAPNAFTYGHHPNNARIVITQGLIDLLEPEELEAVVAHEIGHARHWDMLIMTAANFVPLLLYIFARLLFQAAERINVFNRRHNRARGLAIWAMVLYIVSEYIVLFLSRIREYHADRYAGNVTGNPNALAAALVRVGYGLASGGGRSASSDDSAGLMKQSAFDAFGIFDTKAADAMAIASYDAEDLESEARSARGGVEQTDIDRHKLIDTMKWDLWNPWAKFYELNATHPLVADRIRHLSDQSKALDQRPFLTFDATKPESYWDEFSIDVLVHVGPLIMFLLAFGVGGYMYAADGTTGPLGVLLLIAGLSYVGRTFFSYPSDTFPDHSVASCLKHVKVSGIRGVPVSIDGTLIGRGVPGLIWSEDFVLQDETGIMFLDYRQPLRIWEFFFGLLRNEDYQDRSVRVKGWYRRSPVPYIELKEIQTGGATSTSYVYHVKIAVGVISALVGIALMFLV